MRWPQPSNEDDFEELCLLLLQEHWQLPSLERYGHRGDRQHGVDLWDPHGTSPRRAVQCKHHHSSKTLPPAELEDEVRKARTFHHPIEHYFVVTTGKRSAATADSVGRLNEQHKEQGLFLLTVLYWDDLERLISRSARAQELLNTAPVKATAQQVAGSVQQMVDLATSEQLGTDVLEIRRLVQAGRMTEARDRIQVIKDKKWHSLAPEQKARVLTNLALVEDEEGKPEEASRLLMQAFGLAPNEESSWTNRIFAHTLVGDAAGARRCAQEFSEQRPASSSAWAAVVQTFEEGAAIDEILSALPAWARTTADVAVACAERVTHSAPLGAALPLIRQAAARGDLAPQPRSRIAQCWFTVAARHFGAAPVQIKAELKDAWEYMGRTAADAEAAGLNVLAAECLRLRGMLKDMVGEEEAAGADLGRSVEMHPSSRGRLILAQHLIARGLCEEALSQLERNHAAHDKETTHLLRAVAWWQRNQGDERDRALAEFTRIAGVDGPNELLALTHAVHGLLSKNRANEASQLLESKAKGLGARTYILSARVLLALGEKEAATTVALNALQNFDDQPIWIQRWLALLFASLDRRADALSVWLRVVPEDVLDGDTYALLQLAVELRRDDIVMSRAASLRAAGIYDEWVLQHELATRERYNLADAWNVADTAAKHRPDDKFLTVRRAWIASRRGDPNLVPLQLPDLPRPKEARGEVGRVILHLLAEQQKFKLALEYAYEVYRCYPRDPEALRCMKDVFFTARNALDSFDASEVTSDSAVRVQEKDGSERWFFMEPQDADSSRNEVGPETVLGKELLGSRIGDTVVLASGIAERSAVVREIVPKYVQRMQHVFDNFEILVPDHPELSVMHVGDAKGGFDFEPLLQVLKASRESAERAVALYGENPATSLQALARMLGRTELEALATLVQSNRAVRCARGTREEQAKIATDLAIAQEVVLDLTAALTVFVTETPELLSAHRTRLLTSQGTAEALERALSIKGLNTEGPHTTATLEDGRLVFVEERPETRARRIEQAGSFLKLFRESVSVVPANKLAAWEPQRREVLSDVFGWHGAEAIALATEPGRVLWSDDFCHAEIATREFHCARVWTQAIALQLQEAKLLPVSAYETLSAKLLGLGYEFTSVSRAILRQCGELSDWSITKAALLRAVGYVSKPEIDAQTAAELAAELVGLGWNQMALPASRQNYQVLIQEALLARKDPMESLRAFTSRLPRSFVLNPFGGNQAMKSLVAWAKARGLPFA